MSLIFELPRILEDSKTEYEKIKVSASIRKPFAVVEKKDTRELADSNILARGDNCDLIKYLLEEQSMAGKLQLVYMDPPFYSNASYDAVIKLKSPALDDEPTIKPMAYDDHWKTGMEDYLKMLCVRFYLIRELLSEEGCFWVHLDWHVVHYVKILLDEIFGEGNFVNEIIWNYKSGGTGKRNFSRKHDTLLFYSKGKKYYFNPLQEKSYNRGFKPYRFKGVQEYEDELGWYTMVNMKDVWQIDMVGRTSAERTGYATQKPEQLISRIIESCTREGDLCVDFFSGSGTLAATAEKLGRRWIACDIGGIATAKCLKRLTKADSEFTVISQKQDSGKDELVVSVSVVPIVSSGEQHIKNDTVDSANELQVTIELTGYKMDTGKIPVQGEELEIIKRFRRKDPLQLLEYWSVDFNYDGHTHQPQAAFSKEGHSIDKSCCYIIRNAPLGFAGVHGGHVDSSNKRGPHRISIRAIDVFGNSTLKVVEL